jgi:hypothetical protein
MRMGFQKRVKGSKGTGAPEFPAMFPVPARESRKLVSAWSAALTPGAVENPRATTCSDGRPLSHMALSSYDFPTESEVLSGLVLPPRKPSLKESMYGT